MMGNVDLVWTRGRPLLSHEATLQAEDSESAMKLEAMLTGGACVLDSALEAIERNHGQKRTQKEYREFFSDLSVKLR